MEDIKTTISQLVQNERNELEAVLDDYFSKHSEETNIEFVSANTTYFNISYANKLGGIVYVQYALNELLRDCSGYTFVLNKWGDTPSSETLLVNLKNIEPLPGEFSALTEIVKQLSSPVAIAYHFDKVQLRRIDEFNRALALLHESDVALVVDASDNCTIHFVNGTDIDYVASFDASEAYVNPIDMSRLPLAEYEGNVIGIDDVVNEGEILGCYQKPKE